MTLLALDDAALGPYRQAYAQALVPAVVVENALDRSALAACRGRLDERGYLPYRRLHRGRFERQRPLAEPELLKALVRVAERVTAASLGLLRHEALRLTRGDYLLANVDEEETFPERWVEVNADLSASSSGEAQVIYTRRGENFFAAPQLSGSVSIVDRSASIGRYDRYLNHRVGDRVVHRVRLILARSAVTATEPPPPKVDV